MSVALRVCWCDEIVGRRHWGQMGRRRRVDREEDGIREALEGTFILAGDDIVVRK